MQDKITKEKRMEHLRQRRSHGLSYRALEDEFGESKSNIHRTLNPLEPNGPLEEGEDYAS